MKKEKKLEYTLLWITFGVTLLMIASWFFPDTGAWPIVKFVLWLFEFILILMQLRDKSTTVRVLLITILSFMLLTWVLPAATLSGGQYSEQGRVQMGLFDLFNYPATALSYFGYIALFILAIGGFYGILGKIPAYRTFLDKIASAVHGTEKIALIIIMLLLAVLTSIGGMQLPLLVFFPMLVSIILLMGFDKIVAAMSLVGSVMIGIAATTYGYSNINTILAVFNDLKLTSNVLYKVLILVLGLGLLIFNVMLYIKRGEKVTKIITKDSKKALQKEDAKVEVKEEKTVKSAKTAKTSKNSKSVKGDTKSTKSSKGNGTKKATKKTNSKTSSKKNIKAALKDDEVIVVKENLNTNSSEYVPTGDDSKHVIWPFILMFSLLFILIILAFMPWVNSFGVAAFTDATTKVTGSKIFGFSLYSKLLGQVNSFGNWTIIDLIVVLFVITLVLTLIYKIKFSDILDGFMNGIKKALPVGLIVVLIYTCLVIAVFHPFQLVIYKSILGLISKFGIVGTLLSSLVTAIATLFNVDPAYTFQNSLLYLSSLSFASSHHTVFALVFQSMYGFTLLFAPTSLILMSVLTYLNVPYTKWMKAIWKFLLEFLAVLLIIFMILTCL